MNLSDARYAKYALVREMLDTVGVAKSLRSGQTAAVAAEIKAAGRLMLTGEGSSRIFPAKNAIRKALAWGLDLRIVTEGSRQAAQYDLANFAVFLASNSGRTKEVVLLAKKLAAEGNRRRYALTANEGTLLAGEVTKTWVLKCGWEQACAATKSVVEQALFYQSIVSHVAGECPTLPDSGEGQGVRARDMHESLAGLDKKIDDVLTMPIDNAIIDRACEASTIYFAGYNDGVAEELTLKTNEITRKKSDYLEGSYAVHGIEEVMDAKRRRLRRRSHRGRDREVPGGAGQGRGADRGGDCRPRNALPHDSRPGCRRVDALLVSLCRLEPAGGDRSADEDRSRQAATRPQGRQRVHWRLMRRGLRLLNVRLSMSYNNSRELTAPGGQPRTPTHSGSRWLPAIPASSIWPSTIPIAPRYNRTRCGSPLPQGTIRWCPVRRHLFSDGPMFKATINTAAIARG